jgi:hypothetical protein
MAVPYDEILSIVREFRDAAEAFNALKGIGIKQSRSSIWDDIPTPNVELDIWNAHAWLSENITEFQPTGVALWFDTLNECRGDGTNVGIGMTREADPKSLSIKWAFDCQRYGDGHLIQGIYEAHEAYKEFGLILPNYLFYVGYGGVVLVSALEQIAPNWDCLITWGFHDGGLGYLARTSSEGVKRLALFQKI